MVLFLLVFVLCRLSSYDLRLLISLLSLYCVDCPPSIYGFLSPFDLCIVSTVLRFTASYLPLVFVLCRLSSYDLRLLISLWSLYCVDCPPSIYGFLSPFDLCIVSTVLLRFTASYLPLVFVLCLLSSYDLRLLISLWSLYCVDCPPSIYGFLSPFGLCIVSTVLLRFTASYLPLVFVLCRLSSFDLRLLISLWSLHCVDCPRTIYGFLSPFGLCIVSTVLLRFTASYLPLVFVLCRLSSFDLRLLISLWSLYCVDCPPSIYGFLSPFGLCIVSTVLLRFTASYLPLVFVLCRLSSFDLRLLISLWSLHCVDCPPTIYGFLSPFGLCIVSTVLLRFTASYLPLVFVLCRLSSYDLRLLISLWSLYCVDCPPTIYGFLSPFGIIHTLLFS